MQTWEAHGFLKLLEQNIEWLCVVKVFAIQDPSLPLETYQDQLTEIKNRLAGASNELVEQIISKDPKSRLSAAEFMSKYRGCLLITVSLLTSCIRSCRLTQDQEDIVRIAYAENIASLAETALKFLEMAQLDYANQENNEDDDLPIQYQTKVINIHSAKPSGQTSV
ncbi:Phosphoinositide 3-kinase regulatory subunit 4 [Acropora cervicornis]|uniref:Phosphoinositide 3-kinase regulatory subunit 4 n=1 Tax=Acropora cervicornis TaxID=6130 RepID=A0AAD9V0R6_ACRCE|nr:Phosphoinositide 3-kinase regulatory subunit 4 [Acropora cervicornis]